MWTMIPVCISNRLPSRIGRLWVVENFTYAERPLKLDPSLRDRVLVFEENGDGTFR